MVKPWTLYFARGTVRPLSDEYGMDRGTPLDRYYIEEFMACNAELVRGACLEVEDARYTRRFGRDKVTRGDVLNYDESVPGGDDLRGPAQTDGRGR